MKGKKIRKLLCALILVLITSLSASAVTVGPVVKSDKGMVAAANPLAAEAGAKILEEGGNALDAAIAVSFALGVVEPYASGLGGEGYAVIRMANGSKYAVDFRSTAPGKATYENLKATGKKLSVVKYSPKGACVPGVVAAVEKVYSMGATLPMKDLIEPAIALAEDGFKVNRTFAKVVFNTYDRLHANAQDFLNDEMPWEEGDTFKNLKLAKTLRLIAKEGTQSFYRGQIADDIDKFMVDNSGWMRKSDLESYHVIDRAPMKGTYRGYDIYVPGMPVGGPRFLESLNILENFNLRAFDWDDPLRLHIMQEAFVLSAVDQREYVGDTAFMDLPEAGLASKQYAKERLMKISLSKASNPKNWKKRIGNPASFNDGENYVDVLLYDGKTKPASQKEETPEPPSTTHFSVVDRWGNSVSWTQTISSFFGTSCWVDGFFLNNEMGNFKSKPVAGSPINLEPGKRPRTTIAPMFIEKDGELKWVLGSPGGGRIVSTLVQMFVDLVDYDCSIEKAVKNPKFVGYDTYKEIRLEKGFSDTTLECLKKSFGHKIKMYDYPSLYFGGPNVIAVENGGLTGMGSVRRGGAAAAPDKLKK